MLKLPRIGICGLGTVGGGTLQLLENNQALMAQRLLTPLRVTEVALRSNKLGLDLSNYVQTDPMSLCRSDQVDIVVETIGGYSLAKDVIVEALSNGKHVVTANKALVAEHGNELVELAKEHDVIFAYEAAVAGAIPIIKVVRESLAGNQVKQIAGIINGTGNFILTKMRDTGAPFPEILKEAQDLGYAEADPTFDVEGIDAAHKLTILASCAFGIPLSFDKVFCEGISAVTPDDIYFASKFGYEIKHLGIARQTDLGIELRVAPALVPSSCLLAQVNGVMNAVLTDSDAAGVGLHYGPGAGSLATASSVVSDIVDIARSSGKANVPALGYADLGSSDAPTILSISESKMGHYLRMSLENKAGVVAEIAAILSQHDINIDAMRQEENAENADNTTLVILCHATMDANMSQAISSLQGLGSVKGPINRIRVEHFE